MKYDFLPFAQLVEDVSGGNIKLKGNEYLDSGEIPIIDQGKEFISGYTNNLDAKFKGQLPVIVFGDHTRIFKYVHFSFVMGADGVKVLKLSEKLNPKFAFHYFNSCYIPDTGYNRHFKYLKTIEIPLPPLPEQKRIAEILDKADALRQKNEQLLATYDDLLKATFLEMFGDPVTNPKGWRRMEVAKFSETRLGKMLDKKKIEGNNLKPYLRNSNVLWFDFKLDDLLEMDFNEKDQAEFCLKRGDILMCEGGEIGRCAVWKDNMKDIYFQKAIHRLRMNTKLMLPDFFVWMFWFYSKNGGLNKFLGAATILHLTGINLRKINLPVPPTTLQNQFAQIVENIEAQKTLVKQSLQESEDLFNGLVQKAFSRHL